MSGNISKTRLNSRLASGFTLAEVLITLGVIGVVAAITIPTLVSNYKQKAWDTAATVFERKLEEALKTMNTQQTLAGYRNTDDFVSELSKHFKIIKICQNDDLLTCFEDKVYWGGGDTEPEEVDMTNIKTAANFGQEDWNTDIIGVQLANGTTGLIAYNPDCKQNPYSNQITGRSCLAMLYDTDGFKTPNTSGKDLRGLNVNTLGRVCAFELGGTCYGTPFTPTPLTKAECEAIKDEIGVQECPVDDDSWAGAAKTCGSVDKMPSSSQLAEIANYVYNTSSIGAKQTVYDLTLDEEKVAELGFIIQDLGFHVWVSDECSYGVGKGNGACSRAFYRRYTDYYDGTHNGTGRQAVCIIN